MQNVITLNKPMTIKEGLSINEERRRAAFDKESGAVCAMVNSASKKNIQMDRDNKAIHAAMERQNAALAKALSDMRFTHIAGWFFAGMATMGLICTIIGF